MVYYTILGVIIVVLFCVLAYLIFVRPLVEIGEEVERDITNWNARRAEEKVRRKAAFGQVSTGMDETSVRDLLGPPAKVELNRHGDPVWYYTAQTFGAGSGSITFRDGRVVAYYG